MARSAACAACGSWMCEACTRLFVDGQGCRVATAIQWDRLTNHKFDYVKIVGATDNHLEIRASVLAGFYAAMYGSTQEEGAFLYGRVVGSWVYVDKIVVLNNTSTNKASSVAFADTHEAAVRDYAKKLDGEQEDVVTVVGWIHLHCKKHTLTPSVTDVITQRDYANVM